MKMLGLQWFNGARTPPGSGTAPALHAQGRPNRAEPCFGVRALADQLGSDIAARKSKRD